MYRLCVVTATLDAGNQRKFLPLALALTTTTGRGKFSLSLSLALALALLLEELREVRAGRRALRQSPKQQAMEVTF